MLFARLQINGRYVPVALVSYRIRLRRWAVLERQPILASKIAVVIRVTRASRKLVDQSAKLTQLASGTKSATPYSASASPSVDATTSATTARFVTDPRASPVVVTIPPAPEISPVTVVNASVSFIVGRPKYYW